jgi:predicted metal-dependent peptidase
MITVKQCQLANKDHEFDRRNYAHSYHLNDNIICVAEAFIKLPMEIQMALLAHEVGHLLVGHIEHSEKQADKLANKFFKINIHYRDSLYGNDLQIVSIKDMKKIWEWVDKNVKFHGKLFLM